MTRNKQRVGPRLILTQIEFGAPIWLTPWLPYVYEWRRWLHWYQICGKKCWIKYNITKLNVSVTSCESLGEQPGLIASRSRDHCQQRVRGSERGDTVRWTAGQDRVHWSHCWVCMRSISYVKGRWIWILLKDSFFTLLNLDPQVMWCKTLWPCLNSA